MNIPLSLSFYVALMVLVFSILSCIILCSTIGTRQSFRQCTGGLNERQREGGERHIYIMEINPPVCGGECQPPGVKVLLQLRQPELLPK
ncbi:hypothetical protein BDW42DRAFT_181105 [Aspergillus taichungensis]|uniref:Uncharacterized protein n=1 Tax=Aspergillus taichungensis TaxID=482145 RepID=A0A2J5HEF0_9EURO|nr:hypothetical protein BDW42DRAFT_181105 [Aspergillus taichungensis]